MVREHVALGAHTWTDLDHRSPTLVVAIGSLEQHGPHLPLDTDTQIAAVAAREAVRLIVDADGDSDVVLGPTVPYGASGEHEGFAGTISIGTEALQSLVVELGRSATRWCSRIAIVNGHGGNGVALRSAVTLLRSEGRDATWFPCDIPDADPHAGLIETSAMLALAPDLVRTQRYQAGNTESIAALLPRLREGGIAAVSANGVLGDPHGATAAQGTRSLTALSHQLRDALLRWEPDSDGRLR